LVALSRKAKPPWHLVVRAFTFVRASFWLIAATPEFARERKFPASIPYNEKCARKL